ncbi:serine/threonine-protein kinase [Nonomuraea sp. 3N208]|uniref:serine/threonine-protein kinase n=1 Tax=Nonomuraea sp. 3N208 TaxID=3457421 RepID=UPI003FCFD5DC
MIVPDRALAGRYRLLSRLGGGGHGEVWRAQDMLLDRVVAVKTVRAGLDGDPEFVARFHAEARSMATIDHPGVVGVFDYGIAEMPGRRTPYLVMQYLDGEPLHLLLTRRGRLAPGATMDLVAQAAEALHAAHLAGVVHRDVKPGNLMILPDGTVVLTDFGIARTAESLKLTATGIVLGTATYCAPEQAEGAAPSPAMDVYALGVVAYECLAGRVPFDGENAVAIALKHLHKMPPPLPDDVPAAVGEVVMRALAKDPAGRWPSAAALAAAARALADGLDAEGPLGNDRLPPRPAPTGSPSVSPSGSPTVSPSGSPTGERTAGRRRTALTLGGGLAAVAIAAPVAYWAQTDQPRPSASQTLTGETQPSTATEPSLDPMTHTHDGEPRDTPPTTDPRAKTGTTAEPDTSVKAEATGDVRDQVPATGLLVGGIVHVGGPSPGQPSANGYRPGLVEVFTLKGRRVAGQRADQGGFRFSLPQGGYRLQTTLGESICSTTAQVKPARTTRVELKCSNPSPSPAFQSAAIKDGHGDAKSGQNAGTILPYADLLAAVMRPTQDGVTIEFTTAGAIPAAAPSEVNSRSRWTVSIEQDGRIALLSIDGGKGTWTIQWAAKGSETDQVTVATKPVISGPRVSAALGRRALLKTAPIDFTKPYKIVAAESNVIRGSHSWADTAP